MLKRGTALLMAAIVGVTSVNFADTINARANVTVDKNNSTLKTSVNEVLFPYEHKVNTNTGSENAGDNNYSVWSSSVNSYLQKLSDDTLMRVEAVDGKVAVEYYSKDFKLQKEDSIVYELPIFGGYFCGQNYQFLVFGQENNAESDDTEIMRIVKYDKKWNRLGAASVYGANTKVPFEGGSLRMAEDDGRLFIHTCHKMYKTDDGLNHQANMSYVVNEDGMEIEQQHYGISNIGTGYVSHSFNQFIIADGGYIYCVDHGDAYPRAISITKRDQRNITKCTSTCPLEIQGKIGLNSTGVSVGSFDKIGDKLLIAGNSKTQESYEEWSNAQQKNIFLTYTDTNLEKTDKVWLTNYKEEDGVGVFTPETVKISDNLIYVLWEEKKNGSISTKIVGVDDKGNKVTDMFSLHGRLSDCKPVYMDGSIIWYSSENKADKAINFYKFELDKLPDYNHKSDTLIPLSDVKFTFTEKEYIYDSHYQTPKVIGEYAGAELEEGKDYIYISYDNNYKPGTGTVVLEGKGLFKGRVSLEFTISPIDISKYTMVLNKDKTTYDGTYSDARDICSFYDGNKKVYLMGDYNNRYFRDAGTYDIVFTGDEQYGYVGTLTAKFVIEPKDISSTYVKVEDSSYYENGSEIKPGVEVYDSSVCLVSGKDYKVSYENNINAGTGTICIKGIGNYTGEIRRTFTINPKKSSENKPSETIRPSVTPTPSSAPSNDRNPKVGSKVYDSSSAGWYKVTKNGSSKEVYYVKPGKNNVTSIKIPSYIKINGKKYNVTGVVKKACYKQKKLKKLVLGNNIKYIQDSAFNGCASLKEITIKTVKISGKTVGKKVFNGIYSKAVIRVPKNKLKQYKVILKKCGVGKKTKIVKLG